MEHPAWDWKPWPEETSCCSLILFNWIETKKKEKEKREKSVARGLRERTECEMMRLD